MEIKYSCSEIDESLFGKNLIVGLYDKSGSFIEYTIPNIRTIKKINTMVGFALQFKTYYKNRTALKELLSELDIDKAFEKRSIKTLSTSELIKVQVLEAFLSKSKVIILKNIDRFLNHRDLVRLIKALKSHTFALKKTVILETKNIDNIIAVSDKYIIAEDNNILYSGHDYKQIPINSSIKDFVETANKKGANLNNYKDESDLLKAIYRSVNKK